MDVAKLLEKYRDYQFGKVTIPEVGSTFEKNISKKDYLFVVCCLIVEKWASLSEILAAGPIIRSVCDWGGQWWFHLEIGCK